MAAVRPPARFHRGWIHWVIHTLGGGLRPRYGGLLRRKHKRGDVKSTFISHDLSSAANFHSALCNWVELPAVYKLTVCWVQESDRVDAMCVQMKDLLAYLTSLLAPEEHEMILPLGENTRRTISPDIMRLGFGFLNKFCTNLVLLKVHFKGVKPSFI